MNFNKENSLNISALSRVPSKYIVIPRIKRPDVLKMIKATGWEMVGLPGHRDNRPGDDSPRHYYCTAIKPRSNRAFL
jgi:hypothetical protein